LIKQAQVHDFYIYAHPQGEWVALNKRYLQGFTKGFAGPFVPAQGGRGGHAARGVTWVSGESRTGNLGKITVGSCHYLTDRSEAAHDQSNAPIVQGIAKWGREKGMGKDVVFIGADTNTNDKALDVFSGKPFTTIADELKKYPPTHGRRVIDIIASYDADKRVKAKAYTVAGDKDYPLYSDHDLLHAVYEVAEIKV
jgi:hypothetical protein